jgi:hypothetical protein
MSQRKHECPPFFSDNISIILLRTSGLVRASRTLSIIFFLDTGVFFLVPRSRRSPTESRRRICHKVCFWVAGKESGLSGFDLLLEERVIHTLGWELVFKFQSCHCLHLWGRPCHLPFWPLVSELLLTMFTIAIQSFKLPKTLFAAPIYM